MKTQFFHKLYMTWNVTFMLSRSFLIYYFKTFWLNYNIDIRFYGQLLSLFTIYSKYFNSLTFKLRKKASYSIHLNFIIKLSKYITIFIRLNPICNFLYTKSNYFSFLYIRWMKKIKYCRETFFITKSEKLLWHTSEMLAFKNRY